MMNGINDFICSSFTATQFLQHPKHRDWHHTIARTQNYSPLHSGGRGSQTIVFPSSSYSILFYSWVFSIKTSSPPFSKFTSFLSSFLTVKDSLTLALGPCLRFFLLSFLFSSCLPGFDKYVSVCYYYFARSCGAADIWAIRGRVLFLAWQLGWPTSCRVFFPFFKKFKNAARKRGGYTSWQTKRGVVRWKYPLSEGTYLLRMLRNTPHHPLFVADTTVDEGFVRLFSLPLAV